MEKMTIIFILEYQIFLLLENNIQKSFKKLSL